MKWLCRFLVGGVAMVFVWLAVTCMLVQREGSRARADLKGARQALLHQDTATAETLLAAATNETGRARKTTDDLVWRSCTHIPLLGRVCTVTRGLAATADELARDEIPALLQVSKALRPQDLVTDGVVSLVQIRAQVPTLRAIEQRLLQAETRIQHLPRSTGFWLAGRTRGNLLSQLMDVTNQVNQIRRAAELLPSMLGQDAPRHYFVGFLTNAESRGLGGLLGAYGILEADHGRLHFTHLGANTELKDAATPVLDMGPEYVARYGTARSASDWLESSVPTDFRDVAPVWLALWARQTGQHLDGAFETDPVALSKILEATGPATLPDGELISSGDVVRKVESDAYARFGSGDQTARKAYLVAVARAVVDRLLHAKGNERAIMTELGVAAGQARLRVWSAQKDEESDLLGTSLSGALPAPGRPVAELVVDNAAGNKLDYYLHRTLTYEAHGCGSKRRATATITLLMPALPPGLPAYVTGRVDLPAGAHPVYGSQHLVVTLYAAGGTNFESATLDGLPVGLLSLPERGLVALSADFELLPGRPRTLVVRLRERLANGRVVTPVQPLVIPQVTRVSARECTQ